MVNMLYNIIVLEFTMFFCVTHDYVTVTCITYIWQFVTVRYDIILYSNSKFKNKKIKKNKKKKIKSTISNSDRLLLFQILHSVNISLLINLIKHLSSLKLSLDINLLLYKQLLNYIVTVLLEFSSILILNSSV